MPELIRLPRSAPRQAKLCYLKLLKRVEECVSYGFLFEGSLFQPGKLVSIEELWPDLTWPRIPLLLECAGTQNPRDGRPSSRHWPTLYILWRLDVTRNEWKEIARAASESWDWAVDLMPIAKRLLDQTAGIEIYAGVEQIARRVSKILKDELGRLSPLDRGRALGILHDEFCSQVVRLSA